MACIVGPLKGVLADICFREELFKGNAVSGALELIFLGFVILLELIFFCHILKLGP